jgi:D-aminopeptidase
VTVVVPPPEPLFAASHTINGNGELTGLEWIRDSGTLTTPVGLTNTHSVGVVRDGLVASAQPGEWDWSLPVVGETWDGFLNDINGFHVRPEHVAAALAAAHEGPVEEGSVGGGTGMVCHGFKGGIGTASRIVEDGWTLGVLVQANYGRRARLRVNGTPVGEAIGPDAVPLPASRAPEGGGSIIVLIATDAPLLPGQCERVARRAGFGIARAGGMGERSSGDFALCVATGNRDLVGAEPELALRMVNDSLIDAFYEAVIDAVEESILNAMLASETMTGRNGNTVHGLPHELLRRALF